MELAVCVPASSSEDLAFWLLLYLSQEPMIEETYEILAFVCAIFAPSVRDCMRLWGRRGIPTRWALSPETR